MMQMQNALHALHEQDALHALNDGITCIVYIVCALHGCTGEVGFRGVTPVVALITCIVYIACALHAFHALHALHNACRMHYMH